MVLTENWYLTLRSLYQINIPVRFITPPDHERVPIKEEISLDLCLNLLNISRDRDRSLGSQSTVIKRCGGNLENFIKYLHLHLYWASQPAQPPTNIPVSFLVSGPPQLHCLGYKRRKVEIMSWAKSRVNVSSHILSLNISILPIK